jgi:hypothetical protein
VTAGSEVLRDLAYAPPEPAGSQGHLLDLYLPERTGQPVPVVLWSHGSGWLRENGREGADVVAARLNPAAITPGFRSRWPDLDTRRGIVAGQ